VRAVTAVVLAIGLVVSGSLTFAARWAHDRNEDRLLHQRTREVATVLTQAVATVQLPLTAAATLSEQTGDTTAFRRVMSPLVGTGRQFVSASLWPTGTATPQPLVVVGRPPELVTQSPVRVRDLLDRATHTPSVAVFDLLAAPERGLGFGVATGRAARFVVYVENVLPKNRKAAIARNSAFGDLGYAIYLGRTPHLDALIASSVGEGKLTGRRATDVVPFGDASLYLVVVTSHELGGALLAWLPWLIAGFGIVLTVAAALLAERLVRRRERADALAAQNARLLGEQRTVAQTLQHSLLPERLPVVDGIEPAGRYVAGVQGVDVGGDWYDVLALDDGGVVFVVGDVSGRGLRAATVMASLRFAVRGFASLGQSPATILTSLRRLISVSRDGHFATVVCGRCDPGRTTVTLANAGHPDPLLIAGAHTEFVGTTPGPPIGVATEEPFRETTICIPGGATLLAYTDGLVEQRGESLDVGMERLRDAAAQTDGSLEELLDRLLTQLTPDGSDDDTAILGLRWTSSET
jgi:serine phosphatase RsbU (regulator of sigma subunit)